MFFAFLITIRNRRRFELRRQQRIVQRNDERIMCLHDVQQRLLPIEWLLRHMFDFEPFRSTSSFCCRYDRKLRYRL